MKNPMDIRMMFGVTEGDGWWYCRVCGAMVAERKAHYDWHQAFDALVASMESRGATLAGPRTASS